MKIEFVFTGKTTEKWIEEGCLNYLNRIKRYVKADIAVINPATSGSNPDVQKKKEAEVILKRISSKDLIVLLDEKGKQFTSTEFASEVNKLMCSGKAKIVFVVGGSYGLDTSLNKRADTMLSFSKMTFTHQMIRPLLLEQVYRAFTILKNEKYHH